MYIHCRNNKVSKVTRCLPLKAFNENTTLAASSNIKNIFCQ